MKTAIFGFPGSGKTDLFLALAGPKFKNLNKAMVKVPEPRLDPLIELFNPKKITYTEIEYNDLPGAIKGKSLSNKLLSEIRPFDCLIGVLDGFSGINSPEEQRNIIETDFILSDLSVIEKRLEKLVKDKKKDVFEEELLLKAKEFLEKEKPLRENNELISAPELKGYRFLSAKPILYIWNVSEDDLNRKIISEKKLNQKHITLSVKLEREMSEIDDEEELKFFQQEYGIQESALKKVIKSTYELLDLITFLTAGEKEVRAWPLKKGSTADEAGGVIHSDIQRGFIRAEVLSWEDFLKYKDFKVAKKNGALRLEGRDYIVKDGDIITFYFNV